MKGIKEINQTMLWNASYGFEVILDGSPLIKESITKAVELLSKADRKQKLVYICGNLNNENEMLSTLIKLLKDYKFLLHLELEDPNVFPAYAAMANCTILNLVNQETPSIRPRAIKVDLYNDTQEPTFHKNLIPPILFVRIMPGLRAENLFNFMDNAKNYWSIYNPIEMKRPLI